MNEEEELVEEEEIDSVLEKNVGGKAEVKIERGESGGWVKDRGGDLCFG